MDKSYEENEDVIFEKRESKLGEKFKQIFKNKKIILAILIAVIIVVLAILQFTTGLISNLMYINAGMGNSVGNVTNCGYSAEKNDYIYYVAPSENMEVVNINRVKKGSSETETIFNGGYDIRALNIIGNKIYFISISYNDALDDTVDNKIYKMNLDGSDLTIINDNEFAYDYYDMYVVNNKIYYVGTDYNVYKMDLDGKNRELVVETNTGFLAINEKYIIYNKENENSDDYVTYIRSINKEDEREITGSRIYTPDIYGDYVYYINSEQNIARVSVNGGNEEIIYNKSAYNMNIYNEDIYFLNYKDEENEDYTVCIYKINANGGDAQIVKELSYYASFINLVNGYIYYMDMDANEAKSFINLVNVDDGSEIVLYEWKFGEQN